MKNSHDSKTFQTVVIGGGQAGLAVGYYLAKRGLSFQILDANLRTGDAWRNRWDSLRLFSPARYASLPGLRFPGAGSSFPTKDQVADYLADYAQKLHLPVRHGVQVDRLWKEGDRFVMTAGSSALRQTTSLSRWRTIRHRVCPRSRAISIRKFCRYTRINTAIRPNCRMAPYWLLESGTQGRT